MPHALNGILNHLIKTGALLMLSVIFPVMSPLLSAHYPRTSAHHHPLHPQLSSSHSLHAPFLFSLQCSWNRSLPLNKQVFFSVTRFSIAFSRASSCLRKNLQEFLQKKPLPEAQNVAQVRLFHFALYCNVTHSVPGSVPNQKILISVWTALQLTEDIDRNRLKKRHLRNKLRS